MEEYGEVKKEEVEEWSRVAREYFRVTNGRAVLHGKYLQPENYIGVSVGLFCVWSWVLFLVQ